MTVFKGSELGFVNFDFLPENKGHPNVYRCQSLKKKTLYFKRKD